MRVLQDFDNATPGESEVYSFDFVNEMVPGEAVLSFAFTIGLSKGTDIDPQSRKTGNCTLAGTVLSQRLTNLQSGARYWVMASVTTDSGNTHELWSHVTADVVF